MSPNNINNNQNSNPLKIDIDPVFKGTNYNQGQTKAPPTPSAYNTLTNQEYSPRQTPISTSIIPEKNTQKSKGSIIRTFQGDMASAIQADHLSSVNIAIAENQKMKQQIRQDDSPKVTGDYSLNKIIIFISFILVLAGSGFMSYIFIKQNNQIRPTPTKTFPSLITTEFTEELSLNTTNQNNLPNTLSFKLFESQISDKNFYHLNLTVGTSTDRRLITAPEFVNSLKFRMPDMLRRVLTKDFLLGTYFFNKKMPFFVFKTTSFENTYASMFEWEKNLEKDLQIIFRLSGYEDSGGILAGLNPTISKKFEDAVISNKDVRLLKDEASNIMLLYGIIDRETLVITTSDIAFKEIINRLNQESSLKR